MTVIRKQTLRSSDLGNSALVVLLVFGFGENIIYLSLLWSLWSRDELAQSSQASLGDSRCIRTHTELVGSDYLSVVRIITSFFNLSEL